MKAELTDAELAYFTKVNYHDRMALVALHEDRMVAVGHYERLPGEPHIAEVAFAVSDTFQKMPVTAEDSG